MKRAFYFWLAGTVIAVAVSGIAGAQSQPSSLGDYARAVRKTKGPEKAPAKVYDNDNLPTNGTLSVVGQTPEPAGDRDKNAEPQSKNGEKAEGKSKDDSAMKPGQTDEERKKAVAAWKDKLDEQKSQVSLLSRELDVLQREHQLKSDEFYANPALRLQNHSNFTEEDEKYKKQIEEKQKTLDGAKAKLSDLEDQARRSGVPNSVAQ